MGVVAWEMSLSFAWELSLGNVRLETFDWELYLGTFRWKMTIKHFRLRTFAWKFCLEPLDRDLSLEAGVPGLLRLRDLLAGPGGPKGANRGNQGDWPWQPGIMRDAQEPFRSTKVGKGKVSPNTSFTDQLQHVRKMTRKRFPKW